MSAVTRDHGLKNPRFFVAEFSNNGKHVTLHQIKSEASLPEGVRYFEGWIDDQFIQTCREILDTEGRTWGFAFGQGVKNSDIIQGMAEDGYQVQFG